VSQGRRGFSLCVSLSCFACATGVSNRISESMRGGLVADTKTKIQMNQPQVVCTVSSAVDELSVIGHDCDRNRNQPQVSHKWERRLTPRDLTNIAGWHDFSAL